MSIELIVTILVGIFGGGVFGTIVTQFLQKKKYQAEAKSINLTGELKITDTVLQYSNTLRGDVAKLKEEMSELRSKYETVNTAYQEIKTKHEILHKDYKEVKEENAGLKKRVEALEAENERLRSEQVV